MRVQSQTVIRPTVPILPPFSEATKYAAFAAKVLAWAGVSATASTLQKARAVVGWFAAHAVHPQPYLHPNGTALNTSVLPAGETWATFNATFGTTARTNSDTAYWYTLFPNGKAMLEALIGTVSSGGAVTDNGMLTEYATNQWRIRNFPAFRAVQCTLQCKMAQVVLAALGIHSQDISTVGHDPMVFYEAETGRWLYIDPTYGEMQRLGDDLLTPLDLVVESRAGRGGSIIGDRLPGAEYLAASYFTDSNHPNGMNIMTIHTAPQWAGGISARRPYNFGSIPGQSSTYDTPGKPEAILPQLGCGVTKITETGLETSIALRSNWPRHSKFQRSFDGANWTDCTAIEVLSSSTPQVFYRSLDPEGFSGRYAVLTGG